MSRVIKFRAWDTTHDTMILANNLVFHEFIDVEDHFADEDCIYLQFTGLTDKNGKDIYEGDIVYIAGAGNCSVYWDDKEAAFMFNNAIHEDLYQNVIEDLEIVVGNIYENKEILNGS